MLDWLVVVIVIAGLNLNILVVLIVAPIALGLVSAGLVLTHLVSLVGGLLLLLINDFRLLDKLVIFFEVFFTFQVVSVDFLSQVCNSYSEKNVNLFVRRDPDRKRK